MKPREIYFWNLMLYYTSHSYVEYLRIVRTTWYLMSKYYKDIAIANLALTISTFNSFQSKGKQ